MCDIKDARTAVRTIPVSKAVGMVLAHDITEIRRAEGGRAPFKGRAFKKGHVVREEDISHLMRLGKENLFILDVKEDEMHEDDAAYALANALRGEGVEIKGEPSEGRINLIASIDGLLKIQGDALLEFNMFGDVMCATLHGNTTVRKGQVVAGTRVIPLVVKQTVVAGAVKAAEAVKGAETTGIIEVKRLRRPKAGVVIIGSEVYYGRIKDAFAPIITEKLKAFGGDVIGLYYAPDDESFIEERLRELISAGADLLITTGGMSVDPDDVTRFAIKRLGATGITYGSPVLPGAMFLIAYLGGAVPVLGIPACGMYSKVTIFDIILPRVLTGEIIGRRQLSELGHGGLCQVCDECRWPVCPFGKH